MAKEKGNGTRQLLLFSFQFIIIAALVAVALASDKYPKPYPKPAYPAYPAYAKSYDYVISSPTRNISNAFCLIGFLFTGPDAVQLRLVREG